MRYVSLLLVLLLAAALLLVGCTDKNPEQTQAPAQSANPVPVPTEDVPPVTRSGGDDSVKPAATDPGPAKPAATDPVPTEPAATVPVPTESAVDDGPIPSELETQDSVVIDVTGQPVIGG